MTEESKAACLNCGETLLGDFCWRCGQGAVNLHPSFRQLAGELVGDVFNLDTRLLRTLRPLLFRPGALTREYLAGRRVRHVTPLKTYLIAALVFFGLIAFLPPPDVSVFTAGQRRAVSSKGGSKVSFQLPARYPFFDRALQSASARAKAHPREFASTVFGNLPRALFLLPPIFALLLKLFYWPRDRYYLDHLVFALHYHAFVFLALTLLVVVSRPWVPRPLAWLLILLVLAGLALYLPIALRHVYGGSWLATFLKLSGLAVGYALAFTGTMALLVFGTLSLFQAPAP
jgi:hypothetical protein